MRIIAASESPNYTFEAVVVSHQEEPFNGMSHDSNSAIIERTYSLYYEDGRH